VEAFSVCSVYLVNPNFSLFFREYVIVIILKQCRKVLLELYSIVKLCSVLFDYRTCTVKKAWLTSFWGIIVVCTRCCDPSLGQRNAVFEFICFLSRDAIFWCLKNISKITLDKWIIITGGSKVKHFNLKVATGI